MNQLTEPLVSLFDWVCSVSIMATVLVALILVMQRVLKNRLKPRWLYLMWLLVILRLILPWGPESEFSIYNWIGYTHSVNSDVPMNQEVMLPGVDVQETTAQSVYRNLFVVIWLIGVCLLGIYTVWVNRKFAKKMKKEKVPITDVRMLELFKQCKNMMAVNKPIALVESRHLATPTLFGFIAPQLILPRNISSSLNDDQLRHVFLHELAHSKRNDIGVNWFMHVLLIIHWFNPVLWYGYRRMRDDQEIASDALALSCLTPDKRQDYGYTLIQLLESFSQPARAIGNVNLMGSKKQLQRRIRMIKQFKSNSYRWSFLGIATIVFISGCTLTNPKVSPTSSPLASSTVSEGKSAGADSVEQQSKVSDDTSKQTASGEQQTVQDDATKQVASTGQAGSDNKLEPKTSPAPLPVAPSDTLKPAPSAGVQATASEEKPRPVPAVKEQVSAPAEQPILVPSEGVRTTVSEEKPRPVPSVREQGSAPAVQPSLVPSEGRGSAAAEEKARPAQASDGSFFKEDTAVKDPG
ncbi:M56 family metallopeptidase [Paenibacillus sp. RC67]|uniref:M56 family metallopeptidase n=1 Tax=Paenibacillus sp. RC67 TaxID=3039392 RepID=UPI0024AD14C2|nr:M56 family metallopeptidase [Paenibacillus sp. RC67]